MGQTPPNWEEYLQLSDPAPGELGEVKVGVSRARVVTCCCLLPPWPLMVSYSS